ncbi:(4Fe-4S)-binding protein [Tamlana sp. 2_MG-2023]|uniref:(4Fe-4S)-binding protein n=1 Tax=unclassified Tamlana TaxID=2614803 RepID=UPI0026E15850|nr:MULTISPECIES: (4Fe-4S)-binding protein [unclassified Tamlana]MDO6761190.1 (4Fe-4S)-binding protein [Tamlana sp. 2_MG-2023]MDO6791477.1 (4Fe-4S)-binding protein [Tamlana sp. 1_MG-2023]
METKEYSNGDVTILWRPEKCTHSGICVKTLPKVYNPKKRPWIKPENATSDKKDALQFIKMMNLLEK